ncbi:uroporphyrinogen decarboxylase [Camelimonas abortus]|uniref:Uroporphyrinogen decarboxylase n=1 Tax=Camelimonas abortus TaxID=1017184 RepID=A0ABV7LD12_9HYPH
MRTDPDPSLFIQALRGERTERTPLWMMRQAGRYLPEYRDVRARAGSFLDLCYTPELATEVTLQPIRRFGFDAAILFSDILVVPHALGQNVWFAEGEGPRLDPVTDAEGLARLGDPTDLRRLDPVIETVSRVRADLRTLNGGATALIGFCGAPWTVASYMIAGKGTPDQAPVRLKAYQDPQFLQALVDLLVEASASYLVRQIDAGAQAVQIFESFGSALPPALFDRWCLEPVTKLVRKVKGARPEAHVIVFARGVAGRLTRFTDVPEISALGLDWSIDVNWAAQALQPRVTVQGNLDPLALMAGGDALARGVRDILDALSGGPHIFNLGHGIQPPTPVAHVEELVRLVRAG